MPLLKSQIVFVKKGSTQIIFNPFVDTHHMIFITFPIFHYGRYIFLSNLVSQKGRKIIFLILQKHKISRQFLHHLMYDSGLVFYKHFLKWTQDSVHWLDERQDVRVRSLCLYNSWWFVPWHIYYNKNKFKNRCWKWYVFEISKK